jgi:hypothetical protein
MMRISFFGFHDELGWNLRKVTLCVDLAASMPSTKVPIPDQNLSNKISEEIEKFTAPW